jgi:hypothetical protein
MATLGVLSQNIFFSNHIFFPPYQVVNFHLKKNPSNHKYYYKVTFAINELSHGISFAIFLLSSTFHPFDFKVVQRKRSPKEEGSKFKF